MLHIRTIANFIVLRHWLFPTQNIFDFKNRGGAGLFHASNKFQEMFVVDQSEQRKTIANNFASLMKFPKYNIFLNCMLCDLVSKYLKPSKNQTKCTFNLNFLAVFESRPMRSLVVTMKKVDIPSCIAVQRYPCYADHYLKLKSLWGHVYYLKY